MNLTLFKQTGIPKTEGKGIPNSSSSSSAHHQLSPFLTYFTHIKAQINTSEQIRS